MFSIVWTTIIFAGALYGALCLYLFLMQSRMIFYPNLPTRQLTSDPADIGLEYESVSIVTKDKITLHGWFVPALKEKGVLLFFHGNAGNISHRLDSLKIFHDLGLSTLIIDYRGYGRSQGTISEQGTYLDAEAAWKYLTEIRRIPALHIVVFGRSLGGAIAAYSAARQTPAALILESAFTSVPDLATKLYPVFPVRLLSKFQYNTKKSLQSVYCPVLIIHSPADDIIPFENGLQLYESARTPKQILEIRGDHNEGFLLSGKAYTEGIREFLNVSLDQHKEDKN
jgi:fermentation-respiration switch protein FrsA (DUF1100 family)